MAREMKDSGIAWIGEIPKEWCIGNFRYSGVFTKGKLPSSTNDKNEGLPIVGASEMLGKKCRTFTKDEFVPKCSNTDILILWDGANAGIIANGLEGVVSSTAVKYTCTNNLVDNQFIFYQFKSSEVYFKSKVNGTTIPHMNIRYINDIPLLIPNIQEQQSIANFLDKKCSEIDDLISLQEKMIDELKAYKQSVITEAVTNGLNSNAELKDSGVDWIGCIPKHWNVVISNFCLTRVGDIDHYMPESVDNGIPYVMTGDLKDVASNISFNTCKKVSLDDYQILSKKIKVQKGDIIFARYATIGTVCKVDIDKEFLVSYSCLILSPKKDILIGNFLFYYLKSVTFKEEVFQYTNINIQGNVGKDALCRSKIIIPPIKEQQQISDYLDRKCSEIDTLISIKQQKIDQLKEYKKSLIYEYVTGKKQVV